MSGWVVFKIFLTIDFEMLNCSMSKKFTELQAEILTLQQMLCSVNNCKYKLYLPQYTHYIILNIHTPLDIIPYPKNAENYKPIFHNDYIK